VCFDDKTLERFWKKVEKREDNECWPWTATTFSKGYGNFRVGGRDGRKHGAHRVSLAIKIGYMPEPNEFACHRCDNPICVNPEHLYLGDKTTNMKDKMQRGRCRNGQVKGAKTHNSKLNYELAANIRDEYKKGKGVSALGRQFGVTRDSIYKVINGHRWADGSEWGSQRGHLDATLDKLKESKLCE
jgi:hypothetical protein